MRLWAKDATSAASGQKCQVFKGRGSSQTSLAAACLPATRYHTRATPACLPLNLLRNHGVLYYKNPNLFDWLLSPRRNLGKNEMYLDVDV